MEKHYSIVKEQYNGDKVCIDYSKIEGFKFKPRNNINYGGVKVNSLMIIKPSFIEKLLKKKVKRKLDLYLNYIISLMENSDDTDPTDLRHALNDLERYKSIVEYKYNKYLDNKYITLLLRKINILENEIKAKMIYVNENTYDLEETKGKSR